tara:strand:- start:112 stop:315 length:204 start_codon:yes stop_codon:yes gene_type:complete
MEHKWVVMFEPFDDEGFEYVRVGRVWDSTTPIKIFTSKDEAEKEKRKWNTGVVTVWDGDKYGNNPRD